MKEFILAALPWVLAGLAVAIICAGLGKRKSERNEKERQQHIALGLSLGLLWGVALNNCGLWESQSLGLALGPLWGMAFATLWDDHHTKGGDGE